RWQMRWITRLMPGPRGVDRWRSEVAGIAVERLEPPAPRRSTEILYLHGGGYCLGSIGTHRSLAARIGRATACRVVLPDYPLAPEHPFPAALDAVAEVYRWMRRESGPDGEIFFAGDSAGGGLALALIERLRGETPGAAGAICLSPWTDLTLSGVPRDPEPIGDPMITPEDARRLAALYAGGHDLRDPLISPLYADPAGLPPLLVQVGTREILRADSLRLVDRARAAGVDVTLQEEAGLMHAWQAFAPYIPEANRAIASIGTWVESRARSARVEPTPRAPAHCERARREPTGAGPAQREAPDGEPTR
ncbi:MAG: alpha/beta hydrolase, partial [Thermoanaerobaculia bacterium]|nr:alpha/beta hydrolase [Thermoanaerobaculia bacterium]